MSNVREILKAKGNSIWYVNPQDTIKDTLHLMADQNIGAVLVMEDQRLIGVFSERDFARHSARNHVRPELALVEDMMTTQIFVVSPSQSTEECMSFMTDRRIRHLPVIEGDELIGLVSIGDVVKRVIEDHKFAINQLENYVTGAV